MKPDIRNRVELLSFQQILTFCAVYELGGYSGAEKHLGLAGPTMWEQVKMLERIYGSVLFERAGRNIRPTPAGHVLYKLLSPLSANVESTFEILAEETDGTPKQISLVTGVRMILEELGTPLRKFRQAYPDVKIRLMTADNRKAQQNVTEGTADLALMIEPPPEILSQGIHCERLYPIEYLAVLPSRHRLSRRPNLRLIDLVAEPLIVGNPNTVGRQQLEQAAFRLGLSSPLLIAVETDNSAVTIACVRAGIGVGVIAGRVEGNLTRHVTARSLSRDIGQVHVVAAYREGRQLTRVINDLLGLIKCETRAV